DLVRIQHGDQPPMTLWRVEGGTAIYCGTAHLTIGSGQPEPRPWAIERVWVEGAKGIIAGEEKANKSTHAAELAISLATGTPMWGLPEFPVRVPPARVILIQTENDDRRVNDDLLSICAARGIDIEAFK